jgi:demethylmenaquinone methyltransferase/2-methoxy-6-polyprenyl-1,4-benzoquinol methylase
MKVNGYQKKIAYFDSQVNAAWSSMVYGEDEQKKLERLFSHVGSLEGLTVLEPGCGTGRLTQVLSDQVGSEGKVVAMDISPKMVDVAREKLSGHQNVEIHTAAIEDFPFQPEAFDLILCHQVFPHFEDKAKVLKILAGALKPGHRLIVIHFINFDQINDLHRKAGTAVEHDMMPPDKEMERLFREAGLTVEFLRNDDLGYFLSSYK